MSANPNMKGSVASMAKQPIRAPFKMKPSRTLKSKASTSQDTEADQAQAIVGPPAQDTGAPQTQATKGPDGVKGPMASKAHEIDTSEAKETEDAAKATPKATEKKKKSKPVSLYQIFPKGSINIQGSSLLVSPNLAQARMWPRASFLLPLLPRER
jgi:hypothetical protein